MEVTLHLAFQGIKVGELGVFAMDVANVNNVDGFPGIAEVGLHPDIVLAEEGEHCMMMFGSSES